MTMPLPLLPPNPSDAETVATFRAAAIVLCGEMQRAQAGLCISRAGVFREASGSLYRAAGVIEASAGETSSTASEAFESAKTAFRLVLERLGGWTELHDYTAELAYRRTGVRPATAIASSPEVGRESDVSASTGR
jgi:hypothetical protein